MKNQLNHNYSCSKYHADFNAELKSLPRNRVTATKDRLALKASPKERKALAEKGEEIHGDAALREFLEPLLANSALEWINPSDTGDLTDAPMLGLLGDEVPGWQTGGVEPVPMGWIETAQNGGIKYFRPIIARWAYRDYQFRSALADLRDTGTATFTT